MNLKEYDDIDLYDEEDEYVEDRKPAPARKTSKKKGYGGFIFVIVLLSIAVLAAIGAAVYLLLFTKFDQNGGNSDKPIYTQAQMDEELLAMKGRYYELYTGKTELS